MSNTELYWDARFMSYMPSNGRPLEEYIGDI
jgi:hypothetical protein